MARLVPPVARERRHLRQQGACSPCLRERKVHLACVTGKSRSLEESGHHGSTEDPCTPAEGGGQSEETRAGLELRGNKSPDQGPAGLLWTAERMDH